MQSTAVFFRIIHLGLWPEKLMNIDSELYNSVIKDKCDFGEIWHKYRKLHLLNSSITIALMIAKKWILLQVPIHSLLTF